jgi:hypothetical protein
VSELCSAFLDNLAFSLLRSFCTNTRSGSKDFDAKAVILVDTRSSITVNCSMVFNRAKRHLSAGGPDEKFYAKKLRKLGYKTLKCC